MARKRHAPEQIIHKLREAEVALAKGQTAAEVVRRLGITEQTYYRWRKEYGVARRPGEAAQGAREGERPAEEARGGSSARQRHSQGSGLGKLPSPARRRQAVVNVRTRFPVSERRACRVLGQSRFTQRRVRRIAPDEPARVARVVALAREYGRYGYRRITALLRGEGWRVNAKRVERIWRQEGLKVPQRQPKRGPEIDMPLGIGCVDATRPRSTEV
jgi:transposase-like protein